MGLSLKRIALTFDDGLLNTFEVAYPILRDLGIKATLFVVSGVFTGDVGTEQIRPNDHSPLMTYEQVKELHKLGWEIGSHSHTHRVFDTLDDHDAYTELVHSKELLTEFGTVSFAFPAGHDHFTASQVDLAASLYDHIRNVSEQPSPSKVVNAYPVDDWPLMELKGDVVITCHHRILLPKTFRSWVQSLKSSNMEFVRLRDL